MAYQDTYRLSVHAVIHLSEEHSEYQYIPIADLKDSHKAKVEDCINFEKSVISRKF